MKKQLGKNDVWQLNELTKREFRGPELFRLSDRVEMVDSYLYIANNRPVVARVSGRLIPTLSTLMEHNFLKKVVVDMGAVKFVTSGADVFRPGVKEIDEGIEKDEIIAVVDERHQKPLAVGFALMPGTEIKALDKGKVVKVVHWIGDKIWEFTKTI